MNAEAMADRDSRIVEAFRRESGRLRNFIRRRVPDEEDVEDILQDVFSELVTQFQLEPVRQVGAWLFRVARNRIIDRFRARGPVTVRIESGPEAEGRSGLLEEMLPSPEDGPEAAYARGIMLDELAAALEELPIEQSEVFVAHELEGRSFKELAEETGLSVNTLLARKHYAVLRLRERLRDIYLEYVTNGG